MRSQKIGAVVDGKYKILSELGVGGFGAVYKAEQSEFNRIVALKILGSTANEDREGVARFEREVRILCALHHENIVGVYSCGVADGARYICMQYLEGETLAERLVKQQRLTWQQTVQLGIQICHALEAAHAAGIVHRDMKPQNIILDQGDVAKVLDFGLAGLTGETPIPNQKLTQTGALIGTAHYMSPEICRGQKAEPRSDIYALGCIMYQCLAGRVPLDADDGIAIIFRQATELPPPLRDKKALSTMPPALELAIFMAIQKEPAQRFQTMTDFRECLETIAAGGSASSILTGVQITNNKKVDSKVPLTGVFVGAAFVAGVALTLALVNWHANPTAKPVALVPDSTAAPGVQTQSLYRHDGITTKFISDISMLPNEKQLAAIKKLLDDDINKLPPLVSEDLVNYLYRKTLDLYGYPSRLPYNELFYRAVYQCKDSWAEHKQVISIANACETLAECHTALGHYDRALELCKEERDFLVPRLRGEDTYLYLSSLEWNWYLAEMKKGNRREGIAHAFEAVDRLRGHAHTTKAGAVVVQRQLALVEELIRLGHAVDQSRVSPLIEDSVRRLDSDQVSRAWMQATLAGLHKCIDAPGYRDGRVKQALKDLEEKAATIQYIPPPGED